MATIININNPQRAYLIGRAAALAELVGAATHKQVATIAKHPAELSKCIMPTAVASDTLPLREAWGEVIAAIKNDLPDTFPLADERRYWVGYHSELAAWQGRHPKLSTLCKIYGTTVADVAASIGVTESALRTRLRGNPTLASLRQLASTIGCSLEDLLTPTQYRILNVEEHWSERTATLTLHGNGKTEEYECTMEDEESIARQLGWEEGDDTIAWWLRGRIIPLSLVPLT